MNIRFKKWNCVLRFAKYGNRRTAMILADAMSGERVAVATTNLPDEDLKWDEVFIKDWSENEGMLKCLESHGVIDPNGMVVTGHTMAFRCRLMVEPK
jgi:hypothetical protein